MLNIILDGKRAVIKNNISFEFVEENRRFSNSDSYTLEITFPLKDCKENEAIFGKLYRKDLYPDASTFDCEIIDKALHKKGSAIITEFTESEVKCQFLEGRSGASMTSPIADIYINELEIDSPSANKSLISPLQAWSKERSCVALPWVNNEEYSGNIQNKIKYQNGVYSWDEDTTGLSWMPYLTTVIKGICNAIGYSCDISEIENNIALKYLLVCNVLPQAWEVPEVAKALPKWTVEEFLYNLELFLYGEFEIDHLRKSIKYISQESINNEYGLIEIESDINDFTAEVFVSNSECNDKDLINLKFKESSHRMQRFYDCASKIEKYRKADRIHEFSTFEEFKNMYINNQSIYDLGEVLNGKLWKLIYIKEIDKFLKIHIFYVEPNSWSNENFVNGYLMINEFGERIVDDSKDAKSKELEIVPAYIDYTDPQYGFTLFCNPGSFDESLGGTEEENKYIWDEEEIMEKDEFYDRIFLGWWNGEIQFSGLNPFPNVSQLLCVTKNISEKTLNLYPFSLSINSLSSPHMKHAQKIDKSVKYEFKFITDSLPSVRNIFLIKGKKYVCEKITATFSKQGMSSLVKGVFWRLKD